MLLLLSTFALAGGRPRPELDPATLRWMRDDPCSPINLMTELPDPATAGLLGLSVGFGAGHFYADRADIGALFAVTELGSLGLMGAGFNNLRADPEAGLSAMLLAGAGIFGFARVADGLTAVTVAEHQRDLILYKCEWED